MFLKSMYIYNNNNNKSRGGYKMLANLLKSCILEITLFLGGKNDKIE